MPVSIIALNANCKPRKFAASAFEPSPLYVINGSMAGKQKKVPPDPVNVAIGSAIKRRRRALKLHQADLAEAIGKDIAAVSRIERGLQVASYPQLVRLAERLRTTVGALDEQGRAPPSDDDAALQAIISARSAAWRADLLKFLRSQSEQA